MQLGKVFHDIRLIPLVHIIFRPHRQSSAVTVREVSAANLLHLRLRLALQLLRLSLGLSGEF